MNERTTHVMWQPIDESSLVGKMVIDMSDPNRPRFTLNELRQVLTERNELKTKLIEVEEELHGFKPGSELVIFTPLLKTSYEKESLHILF